MSSLTPMKDLHGLLTVVEEQRESMIPSASIRELDEMIHRQRRMIYLLQALFIFCPLLFYLTFIFLAYQLKQVMNFYL